jgi:isoleucyl-tRNA synthetase
MKNYELNVNYQTILTCGGYFERPNLVFVGHAYDSYGEDRRREFHTLFHELRHYYQYMTQMFSFDAKSYYSPVHHDWDEKRIKLERYFDYLNFPWELDAQAFAQETLTKFWRTPLGEIYLPKPKPPFIPSTTDFVVNPTFC